eukprot:366340-Chlamydomonas_euryale.AAC.11
MLLLVLPGATCHEVSMQAWVPCACPHARSASERYIDAPARVDAMLRTLFAMPANDSPLGSTRGTVDGTTLSAAAVTSTAMLLDQWWYVLRVALKRVFNQKAGGCRYLLHQIERRACHMRSDCNMHV